MYISINKNKIYTNQKTNTNKATIVLLQYNFFYCMIVFDNRISLGIHYDKNVYIMITTVKPGQRIKN